MDRYDISSKVDNIKIYSVNVASVSKEYCVHLAISYTAISFRGRQAQMIKYPILRPHHVKVPALHIIIVRTLATWKFLALSKMLPDTYT